MTVYNFKDILESDYKSIKKHLDASKLLIYPTETSYAIGANALDETAVKKIYDIKQRDINKPMPILIKDLKMLIRLCFVKRQEEDLISIFWPGPLTILFESKLDEKYLFNCGSTLIAARISSHPFAEGLFKEIDYPLIATSLNISGEKSIINLNNNVNNDFSFYENEIIAVDDGILNGGSSTIIKVEKEKINIARPGENNIKERFMCYIKNING